MIPGDVYRGSADSLQAQLQHHQAQRERAERHVRRLQRLLHVRLFRLLVQLPLSVLFGLGLGHGCGAFATALVFPAAVVPAPAPPNRVGPTCRCAKPGAPGECQHWLCWTVEP